jgi:hypothetical protein
MIKTLGDWIDAGRGMDRYSLEDFAAGLEVIMPAENYRATASWKWDQGLYVYQIANGEQELTRHPLGAGLEFDDTKIGEPSLGNANAALSLIKKLAMKNTANQGHDMRRRRLIVRECGLKPLIVKASRAATARPLENTIQKVIF